MIDAHQHFWRIGEHDCRWPDSDLPALFRHFEPADLTPLLQANGIKGTVLVQSQESDADTDYLLQIAAQTDFVKAVVGWVDLAAVDAPKRIRALAQHPKMRGLRPMLQGMADDAWLLDPILAPAIAEMQVQNLSLDALIFPRHLPVLREFALRYPDLPIVIDHAAKPGIAQDDFDAWSKAIAACAELPNVFCKLSGLLTEASATQSHDAMRPYVAHLYKVFGANSLMWGSDWPVLNAAPNQSYANYSAWLTLATQLFPSLSLPDREAIFSATAREFYRI